MTGTAYTNLGIIEPGIGDPSTRNAWGALLNTDMVLIDTITSGVLSVSVAGTGTTILTFTQGAADQVKHAHFVFTGVLTGDRTVLWPQNVTATFSVQNDTTGAFNLIIGANDGGGSAAGTTQTVQQAAAGSYVSNGTDVNTRVTTSVGAGTVTSVATGAGLTGGPVTTTGTVALAAIADQTLLGNSSGGALAPSAQNLSTFMDTVFGNAQGDILIRGASTWQTLPPGTSGQFLKTLGASANPSWADSTAPAAASTTQMAVGTAANVFVSPSVMAAFSGVSKGYLLFAGGVSPSITRAFNVTSLSRTGTGVYQFTIGTVAGASQMAQGMAFGFGRDVSGNLLVGVAALGSAPSITISMTFYNLQNNPTDPSSASVIAFGV